MGFESAGVTAAWVVSRLQDDRDDRRTSTRAPPVWYRPRPWETRVGEIGLQQEMAERVMPSPARGRL